MLSKNKMFDKNDLIMEDKMKFVVAVDSFKGSVTSERACASIERGIKKAIPDAEVVIKPIADGGEGTLDAIVPKEKRIDVLVNNPLFEITKAQYGAVGDTAVIEMAAAAGLTLIDEARRNAGKTTTYGVGELIRHALKSGFGKIMLTAGGSATNDGGCGMLAALGAVFKNADGNSFVPVGDSLSDICEIDLSGIADGFCECEFSIATDVKNPLLGENGATFVYGPQKGLANGQRESIERGMKSYSELLLKLTGKDVSVIEGAGAGGGIAVPLLAFAKTEISSGIETVLDAVGFDVALDGACAVITGEGRIDAQSLCGKAISGVAKQAAGRSVPVYCFVGCVGDDVEKLKKMGVADIYTVISRAESPEDSINNAEKYLALMAEEFARSFK